jgi:predicted transcriptional regulator
MKVKKLKVNEPTKSELQILSVLWKREQATVREVFEIVNQQRPASYTTVLKLMQIMHEKGLVERDAANKAHVYRAKTKQNETGRQLIQEILHKIFGGSALKLVQQVLETETTSAEEMKQIRKMIKQAEKQAAAQTSKKGKQK